MAVSETPGQVLYRSYPLQQLRAEQDAGDERPKIRGYAAVFNRLSEVIADFLGLGYRERIQPGAFTKTIQTADVRALVNHDPSFVLGRNKSGTLSLKEDEHGLAVVIDPPDTQWARDLMVSLQRGDVDQMSFGFRIIRDDWEKRSESGKTLDVHVVKEVALFDVSVVTYPAYRETEAAVRASLTDTDRAAIRTAIRLLSAYLPPDAPAASLPAAPVQTDHAPLADAGEGTSAPPQTGHPLASFREWLASVDTPTT